MDDDVTAILQKYEDMIKEGKMIQFCVSINDNGLLIQPDGSDEQNSIVPLTQDLHTSLHIFFDGVASIPHNSFDYTTLKSLINAHNCIDRMTKGS